MAASPQPEGTPPPPLSAEPIPEDVFHAMRRENLARWPTGAGVDIDEAVAFHQSLPRHKRLAWVMRRAAEEGRCLTQPRGGFGTLELQMELVRTLDEQGLADIVPTTTDSYTRNERWESAQKGVEESKRMGRSMLNGFPMVNYGVAPTRTLIEAIDKPAIVLSGTAMPRLTSEIGLAAGYSGYLGSGIAYTASYTKEVSIADGIRNYQYLDRLAALYMEKGVELHRRQPGFLTGTNIPPFDRHHDRHPRRLARRRPGGAQLRPRAGPDAASDSRRRRHPGVRRAGPGIPAAPRLQGRFHAGDLAPLDGAWPHDDAQSAALVAYGGTLAAIGGAVSVTTKTVHEAFGIPTLEANAEGLRMTRMAIYLARHIRLDEMPEFQREAEMIRREVRAVVDKVLEMGDGDAAVGTVRAFAAGVLDIPWSPNREVQSRVLPARDGDGYLRIFDAAAMPIPAEVMEFHEERLRRRAEREGVAYDHELAVSSVYEISEPLDKLIPFPWAAR